MRPFQSYNYVLLLFITLTYWLMLHSISVYAGLVHIVPLNGNNMQMCRLLLIIIIFHCTLFIIFSPLLFYHFNRHDASIVIAHKSRLNIFLTVNKSLFHTLQSTFDILFCVVKFDPIYSFRPPPLGWHFVYASHHQLNKTTIPSSLDISSSLSGLSFYFYMFSPSMILLPLSSIAYASIQLFIVLSYDLTTDLLV